MSFREKLAWAQLVALLGFGAVYFGPVFGSYLGWAAVPGGGQFMWLVVCIIGLIVGQIILAGILAGILAAITALRTPREVDSPADERDRQISLLGHRTGYYLLVLGAIVSMVSSHHGADSVMLVNFMFFALLVAELARLGTAVFLYRRGW